MTKEQMREKLVEIVTNIMKVEWIYANDINDDNKSINKRILSHANSILEAGFVHRSSVEYKLLNGTDRIMMLKKAEQLMGTDAEGWTICNFIKDSLATSDIIKESE